MPLDFSGSHNPDLAILIAVRDCLDNHWRTNDAMWGAKDYATEKGKCIYAWIRHYAPKGDKLRTLDRIVNYYIGPEIPDDFVDDLWNDPKSHWRSGGWKVIPHDFSVMAFAMVNMDQRDIGEPEASKADMLALLDRAIERCLSDPVDPWKAGDGYWRDKQARANGWIKTARKRKKSGEWTAQEAAAFIKSWTAKRETADKHVERLQRERFPEDCQDRDEIARLTAISKDAIAHIRPLLADHKPRTPYPWK
jgi:hypothetical protein